MFTMQLWDCYSARMNTIALSTLEEQLEVYHNELRDSLSIEKLKDYMDDPESINEKTRKALLPYAPDLLVKTIQLAFHSKSDQVKLNAIKWLGDRIWGPGIVGASEGELDKLVNRLTSSNDITKTNNDI